MPRLSEDERKELYDQLLAKKQGRSNTETGNIIGSIAQGISDIATADAQSRGLRRQDVGQGARSIGAAQDAAEESQSDKWRKLLKMDSDQATTEYNQNQDTLSNQRADKKLDWDMSPDNPRNIKSASPTTARFETKQGKDGSLYQVDRISGDYKVLKEGVPEDNTPKPRQVPAGVAVSQGQLEGAGKILDDLHTAHSNLDTGVIPSVIDTVTGNAGIPNTDGDIYENQRRATAQSVGTILENGKLTDADFEDKYLPLVPGPNDNAESAQSKIDNLRLMLQRKQEGSDTGLSDAGYDTGEQPISEDVPAPTKQVKYNGKLYNVDATGNMTEVN